MKITILFFVFLIPVYAFADIAGPVMTKSQACMLKDWSSWNRLQISLNGKTSDTMYFYKFHNNIFYTVSFFPYSEGLARYYAAVFLYQYDCNTQKITRISGNLKPLVKTIWWPVNGEENISLNVIKELGYWQIHHVTNTGVTLNLFIPQTGVYSNNIAIPIQNP